MADDHQSPLLGLPPELRIMIYDFIFAALPQTYHQTKKYKDLNPTNLLHVCTQIRAEASPAHHKWIGANASTLLIEDVVRTEKKHATPGLDPIAQAAADLEDAKATLHGLRKGIDVAWKVLDLSRLCAARAKVAGEDGQTSSQGVEKESTKVLA